MENCLKNGKLNITINSDLKNLDIDKLTEEIKKDMGEGNGKERKNQSI